MTFTAPWWLLLLALTPAIAWLHFTGERRHRVGSVMLWRRIVSARTSARVIRRPESLAHMIAQILVVVLVSLALANPTFGSDPPSRSFIAIVDGGISMAIVDDGQGPRFNRALRSLTETWHPTRDGPISVAVAGQHLRYVVNGSIKAADVQKALDGLHPSDTIPDWEALLSEVAEGITPGDRVIIVSGDARVPEQATRLLGTDAFEFVSYAEPFRNLSVSDMAFLDEEPPTGRGVVRVTVEAIGFVPTGATDHSVELWFRPLGADREVLLDRDRLAFSFRGIAEARFDVSLSMAGTLAARIDPPTAYPADDVRMLAYLPQPHTPNVHVVTPRPDDSPTARLLEALEGIEVSTGRSLPTASTGNLPDVIVMESAWVDGQGAWPHAVDTVIWIGSAPSMRVESDRSAVDSGVASWDASHPATGATRWDQLDATRAFRFTSSDTRPMATLVDGIAAPLVWYEATVDRRDLVIALDPFDDRWSMSNEFLTLVHDAVVWYTTPLHGLSTCVVGVACRIPYREAREAIRIHQGNRTLARFAAPQEDAFDETRERSWTPYAAGIATIESTDASRDVIVHPSAASVPFLHRLTMAASDPDAGPLHHASIAQTRPAQRYILTILAVGAAALMVTEALMAGRRHQSFLKLSSLYSTGGAGGRDRLIAVGLALMTIALLGSALGWPIPVPRSTIPMTIVLTPSERSPAVSRVVDELVDRIQHNVSDLPTVSPHFVLDTPLRSALEVIHAYGGPARAVVVTDHDPTVGEAAAALLDPRWAGVRVDLVHVAEPDAPFVAVDRVTMPERVRMGESLEINASLFSSTPQHRTEVTVLLDNEVVSTVETVLAEGHTLLTVPWRPDMPGEVDVVVSVTSMDVPDVRSSLGTIAHIGPAPSVHVFATDIERAQRFGQALELHGLSVTVRPTHTIPSRPALLVGIDGIVLFDSPALALTSGQQAVLEAWVRDHGGGLVVTGGTQSFGPGGYVETILDRLLPVSSMVTRDRPEVALVYVLDRSGSMQQAVAGITRLDVAKQATMLSAQLLGDGSQIAIVVFDEEASVLLDFTPAEDTTRLDAALAPLVPGGGTAIYPGLRSAHDLLTRLPDDVETRHVIVMTDGLTRAGDFDAVISEIRATNATVSAIAIGVGADVDRVQTIAELGGGTAHVTTDFLALPGILAQEALRFSDDAIVEESVVPSVVNTDDPLMVSVPQALPILSGLVETTLKADATLHLRDDEDRPLLASWRYGAGSVLAFTSDADGPWTAEWRADPGTAARWAQWIRAFTSDAPLHGFDPTWGMHRDELIVSTTVTDNAGTTLTGLVLQAHVRPSAEGREAIDVAYTQSGADPAVIVPLVEAAPGRYTARTPLQVGRWSVTLSAPFDESIEPFIFSVLHTSPAAYGSARYDLQQLQRLERANPAVSLFTTDDIADVVAWQPDRVFSIVTHVDRLAWFVSAAVLWFVTVLIRYGPRLPVRMRGRRTYST